MTGRKRILAVALVMVVLMAAGCQSATAGRRCRGNGFAQDRVYVLQCKRGRWVRTMTKAAALKALARIKTSTPTPAPGGNGGPLPVNTTPHGSLDEASGQRFALRVRGWARDEDSAAPITVRILEGFNVLAETVASQARVDVPGRHDVGFSVDIASLGGPRYVCVQALNAAGTGGATASLGCRTVEVDAGAPTDPLSPAASWLDTMNYYRVGSGVAPVTQEPAWSVDIVNHLHYLANTPSSYFTGQYANRHTENPASPFYSASGAAGGGSSNLGGGRNDREAIEGWMTAPFHAIGILRPALARSAFGMLSTSAGLDVIRGIGSTPTPTAPVLFPGNGTIVRLKSFTGEFPSPLESCAGFPTSGTSLPLIALLPDAVPSSGVTATMTLPNGAAVAPADLCVVTEHTFVSSDAIYGPTGRSILAGDHAVLVIARQPLTPGAHSVTLTVPGRSMISWGFSVSRS